MLSQAKYENLIAEVKEEFPDFEIKNKSESSLMDAIDIFLKIITFNQMNSFMKNFTTTLGNKIYVPSEWNKYSLIDKSAIIRHERVHMRQARKYTRPLFSFLYVAVLPLGFAYFRKKFEQEAYEESLKAYYEYYGDRVFTQNFKNQIIGNFTSAQYFWIWLIKSDIEKWYDESVTKIKSK
jgi:hypothetical protein